MSTPPSFAPRARAVLDGNWRDGYTLPSPRLYPFQWNWDAGFNALGWCYHRPERAQEEIRSLFRGQWRNGMLPHIVFHRASPDYFPGPDVWQTDGLPQGPAGIRTSGITQPPVFGFILERMAAVPGVAGPEWDRFLAEILPRVVAFHRYLYEHRDPTGEGLVCVQHNWESADNSPLWDHILDAIPLESTRDVSHLRRDIRSVHAAHRPTHENYRRYIYLVDLFARERYDDRRIQAASPFLVQDVMVNALLVRSNEGLIRLGAAAGLDVAEIAAWNRRTISAMNAKLWNEAAGHYFPFDLKSGRQIPIRTSLGLTPLFAGVPDAARARILCDDAERNFRPAERWLRYGSTAPTEASFNPEKYWRGPVWINLNWMIHHGLRRYGRDAEAREVAAEMRNLIERFGASEYFDPRPEAEHGRALGADAFSWTAALYLDLIQNPNPL